MAIVQWVNLDKDEAYAKDPDVGSVERCGPLSLKAIFQKDQVPVNFTVRVLPQPGNIEYTAAELAPGRNPNFKMPAAVSGLGATKETILENSIKLPAVGGNKYKIEAKDANGTTVESIEVEARRKLYYQLMHMDDKNGTVPASPLTQLETHCNDYVVFLSRAGSIKKIPFQKTVAMTRDGTFNYDHFAAEVGKAYDLDSPLKRVGCVSVWSNYLATMFSARAIQINHTIGGTSNPNCEVRGHRVTLKLKPGYFLWYGLDDADDLKSRWFESCKVEYLPPGATGPADVVSVSIDRSDVAPAGKPAFPHGGYNEVSISASAALKQLLSKSSGTIAFTLKVNLASFTGGFSYPGGGFALTTCCTKAWWMDVPAKDSEQTWNHELGHRMGMVAYGNKDHRATNPKHFFYKPHLPDAPSSLYGENREVNDKGHKGPHCQSGVTYAAATDKWSGVPGCVMFGANRTSEGSAPLHYCDECKPIVKKLDLSF